MSDTDQAYEAVEVLDYLDRPRRRISPGSTDARFCAEPR